jgi:cytochrome o ubiquinol oxidase subunit 3
MTKSEAAQTEFSVKQNSKTMLGFWIYLMTDCVLFASLFATYAVLKGSTFGGPSGKELFDLPFVLIETLLLLTSSFTAGLAILGLHQRSRKQVLAWFAVTFILGVSFLVMEISEFAKLAGEGNSWSRSGFLSAFFTLVGTHGLHIATGLLWMIVVGYQVLSRGLTESVSRRLTLLSLFWHFLDIIWIFIFTIVYLMGVI